MNWTNFQTYGMAPDKAFEVLCNQLFENWSKEEYKSDIASIRVVNGAGGDGGVESYATLKDGSIIGLQAKWFPTSMVSSQIAQIKNSIKTAKKVRPEISRYIVCVLFHHHKKCSLKLHLSCLEAKGQHPSLCISIAALAHNSTP